MARGNPIVISTLQGSAGDLTEGIVAAGETHYPGVVVQVDPTVARVGGRNTYKLYTPGTDGEQPLGPFYVVTEDHLRGRLATVSYAAGEREFLYCPQAGDELNMLIANVSGTATIAAGTKLMVDTGTGKLIATTGSPETEVAVLMEDVVDNAADQLAWVRWSGH